MHNSIACRLRQMIAYIEGMGAARDIITTINEVTKTEYKKGLSEVAQWVCKNIIRELDDLADANAKAFATEIVNFPDIEELLTDPEFMNCIMILTNSQN